MSAEAKNEVVAVQSSLLPVNQQAVEELQKQRNLLGHFVRSQLKEADFTDPKSTNYGEGDYGVIPGTKKNCLFKQGAEKLLRLFGLGVRFRQVDKDIDKAANFALYTYRAEVYHLKTGQVISECDATANSQEKKWKERTEWSTNGNGVRQSKMVETPIFDVLNTLQKMAQKRALIGATLLATGASEYFTQDVLDGDEDLSPPTGDNNQYPPKQTKEVKSETSPPPSGAGAPQCCGQDMRISQFMDKDLGHKPWYCLRCRQKKSAQ